MKEANLRWLPTIGQSGKGKALATINSGVVSRGRGEEGQQAEHRIFRAVHGLRMILEGGPMSSYTCPNPQYIQLQE